MPAANLVLGPLLRYVGETEATIWVETDEPCEVSVLDGVSETFSVAGHNYALVTVDGLEPGSTTRYEVNLDGEKAWPPREDRFPDSTIRTLRRGGPLRVVFGSCRIAAPHEPPWTLSKDDDDRGRERDALYALALRMTELPEDGWPHLLLMAGDQVYADEDAPQTREFIRSRRDTSRPPGEGVADFEEYTSLYRESWGDPVMRWLLSAVSTAMVFDDHDVHDDWNTSAAWVEEMRAQPWWEERIVGAYMSYWIYQHLGNLAPADLREDHLLEKVRAADDGEEALRRFAHHADRDREKSRWSYARDLAGTKLVVADSRGGRILNGERRCMVSDDEWAFIESHTRGDFDHLLLVSSLPFLLQPGLHWLEAWNEAVCAGAWGDWARGPGEKLRQGFDLEHWAAFGDSFRRVEGLLEQVATGHHGGSPPASIVMLSGDVHNAYLAEVGFRRGTGARSNVWQAVCSPFRNPLDAHERAAMRLAGSRTIGRTARALARSASVPPARVHWRLVEGPWFDNQVASLHIEGRRADMRLERTSPGSEEVAKLDRVFDHVLA